MEEPIMQWLIQCTDLPDTNTLKLLEEVKKRRFPYVGIGVRPFTHEIIDIEKADPKAPTMFYGSTQLIETISKWEDFRPGAFYEKEWFDPRFWPEKRSDMLNQHQQEITIRDLRLQWVDTPTFIKSIEPKVLAGMVIEPIKEDHDNWMIEYSELDGDVILVMSEAQNIEAEWRFFIVGGEVITGSTYRWLGARTIRRPVESLIYHVARLAIKEWIPNLNIVMDICQLKDGNFRVVEFNAVNSSGFYSADVGKVVDAIEIKY